MYKTIFCNIFLRLFMRNFSTDVIIVCHFNIIFVSKFICVKKFNVAISSTLFNYLIYLIKVWSNKVIFFNNDSKFSFVFMRIGFNMFWFIFNSMWFVTYITKPYYSVHLSRRHSIKITLISTNSSMTTKVIIHTPSFSNKNKR